MNPDAKSYTPTFVVASRAIDRTAEATRAQMSLQAGRRRGKMTYTRDELLRLQLDTRALDLHGRLGALPFILDTCSCSVQALLQLPYMKELISPDAYSMLGQGDRDGGVQDQSRLHSSYESGTAASNCDVTNAVSRLKQYTQYDASARNYNCRPCAMSDATPCEAMQNLLRNIRRDILTTSAGACLLQGGTVVWSLTQAALVFETKQSSLRMRQLADKCPRVVHLVTEYLCGEGYHMPLPGVTEHDKWKHICALLKFDAIRDNQTRVKTDLSKHWRRRTTPFEQFVFFFTFRDDRPRGAVRNVITRSVKPGVVAMLTGDMVAMLLLHHLGFFLPPDYYWNIYPFLREALGAQPALHDVIRHLAVCLSNRQDPELYNPVPLPTLRPSAAT